MAYQIDREVAKRVVETVDKGLSKGLGKPTAGNMCVEAAVCYAMGMPHGDNPVCVGSAVRAFKIRLNDANWSSKAARAAGMRRVAVAQLGSDKIDQKAFAQEVTLQVVKQILPIALRAAANAVPTHAADLEAAAVACEGLLEFSAAIAVAKQARSAAAAAAASKSAAAASKSAAYAAYAADAAYAYAAYAADAAADASKSAAAAYAAAAYAADKKEKRDSILSKAAEIGVQALIKLGAQGCEWLDLCD